MNNSQSKINLFILKTALTLLFFPLFGYAQVNTTNQQVKRLQRAIFIFNFAEQVTWQNQDDHLEFKIGVLGPDRTFIDLAALSQKRNINNKKVKIIKFNSVKDVSNVQLLYVNKSFNFDIDYILNKISNKNILLVSEGYSYKTSMINMVNIGNTFEYEINNNLLNAENFTIANSLNEHSISSSEKWKKLFKTTEASLEENKKLTAEKQADLKNKEQEIENNKEAIAYQKNTIIEQKDSIETVQNLANVRKKWLDLLSQENNLQKQELNSKIEIEQELEKTILSQLEILKNQEDRINSSNALILSQDDSIKKQQIEIRENSEILKGKNNTINTQRSISYLLVGIILLALLGAFLLYKNYKIKTKLSQTLKVKNAAILKQSQELEIKNNELEQFAYIASHDLKEPLITISSLIDLLVEDYGEQFDEDGRLSLKYVKESSYRMQKLIEGILSYSKLGKSKVFLNIDCNNLITILRADLDNVFTRTKTELTTANLPIVKGTELEIRLLFQNLISNAIKFTKPNVTPKIKIEARQTLINNVKYWEFSITDNGIGIPKKHKERIFSIFQRLHSRDQYQGTGIGLAHCKKIVEAHDGKIWFESTVNVGSTFFFTIPV
ncbi:YfiR/HmsC family protein [Lacinutrix algicola]|uniref:YfiR/HmsC family protein n=1 Tax=Lacinutrix algicola TaxID=342954 RepID=UPI0006E34F2E|nr:YfiR/HmsC family protein [Lacinutrix algicola]